MTLKWYQHWVSVYDEGPKKAIMEINHVYKLHYQNSKKYKRVQMFKSVEQFIYLSVFLLINQDNILSHFRVTSYYTLKGGWLEMGREKKVDGCSNQ